MEQEKELIIYALSDSIGETAELIARAAGSQFENSNMKIIKVSHIKCVDEISKAVKEASEYHALIAYTLVRQDLKDVLVKEAQRYNLITVDVLTPMLQALTAHMGCAPKLEPGLIRRMDKDYFRKVEAIEFAVKYDDGKDARGILEADIVILGVSRTSKTPLCMYLAHKQIKAANVPLVPEVAPPEEIFNLPRYKLFGLTSKPTKLNEIRQERLKSMGLGSGADYASFERILKELDYAENIMKRAGCHIIDVSNRAVEETCSYVLEVYHRGIKNAKQ